MTVLLRSSDGGDQARDVLVFGSGGIGAAITSRLRGRRAFSPVTFVVPWNEPSERTVVLNEIDEAITAAGPHRAVSVVWAAGSAGFSATTAQTESEFAAFQDVVALASRIHERSAVGHHAFHVVSSAGGLYEGRAVQSPSDIPTPVRAYGHLKLAEEQHALTELPHDHVVIHRPSSVYTIRGARAGLLGALVRNGLALKETRIVGTLDTLRDYVRASDVGGYVADAVLADEAAGERVHMLVAGQPISILRAITVVETVVRRRLYIRLAQSWNARNITFAPAVRAPGFRTPSLRVGVEQLHAAALGTPMLSPRRQPRRAWSASHSTRVR